MKPLTDEVRTPASDVLAVLLNPVSDPIDNSLRDLF
ncbi:Uncharacterised protein [Mycobacteroides abscessus subsp. bolletii]|nr:Uncharacterised protein [Mycobacteroides abscessus]SKE68717.1 Uncharacterised protein [Mycobacteroides abscessus subsp. bolletii]SKF95969.1 Uncharacterised protein [Mycobacteroides abscessus subsp. bolletii]